MGALDVAPGGRPSTAIVKSAENPFAGTTVIAYLRLVPILADCEEGEMEAFQSGAEERTPKFATAEWESGPLVAVMVMG